MTRRCDASTFLFTYRDCDQEITTLCIRRHGGETKACEGCQHYRRTCMLSHRDEPRSCVRGSTGAESLVPSWPAGLSSTGERRGRNDESRAVDSSLSGRYGPHRSATWADLHLWGRIPQYVGRSASRG